MDFFQVSHWHKMKRFTTALVALKLIFLRMLYKFEKTHTQSAKSNSVSFQLHGILHYLKKKKKGVVRNNKVLHFMYSYTLTQFNSVED